MHQRRPSSAKIVMLGRSSLSKSGTILGMILSLLKYRRAHKTSSISPTLGHFNLINRFTYHSLTIRFRSELHYPPIQAKSPQMASSVTQPSHVRYNATQISLSRLTILTIFREKRKLRSSSLYSCPTSDLTSQVHIFSPVYAVLSQCQTKFHTHTEHRHRVLEVHVDPTIEYTTAQTVLHLHIKCKQLFILWQRGRF